MPPALEASSEPVPAFDFEFERGVMQQEASGLVERFLAQPEGGAGAAGAAGPSTAAGAGGGSSSAAGTRAGKFVAMGYTPAAVHLALAYQASVRGDDAAVIDFCNGYTQLLGMGFGPALAAGALARAKNDAAAAADLCLAASSAAGQ